MAVGIITDEQLKRAEAEALSRGRFVVPERLCLRYRDNKLVPERECDAGSLVYARGQEISFDEAVRKGLTTEAEIQPDVKPEIQPDVKQAEPVEDKQVNEVEDKSVRRRR